MSFDEVSFDDICSIKIQNKENLDSDITIKFKYYEKTNHFQNNLEKYISSSAKTPKLALSQFGMGKTAPSLSINFMYKKLFDVILPELPTPDTEKIKNNFDELEEQYIQILKENDLSNTHNEPSNAHHLHDEPSNAQSSVAHHLHDEGWKKICAELKWDFPKK